MRERADDSCLNCYLESTLGAFGPFVQLDVPYVTDLPACDSGLKTTLETQSITNFFVVGSNCCDQVQVNLDQLISSSC